MKYIAKQYHIIVCLLMVLGALFVACNKERPDETELVVLYSSDVMNYTLPFDFLKDKPSEVSLANFASFVKDQRSQYGENCIVLDNGNKLLGTVPSGYFNYIQPDSEPLAFRVERMIGYDAVGIGDKDLDVPTLLHPTNWNPALQPEIVCANLVYSSTQQPVFAPYKIIERQGIRIAVLGLVSPNVMSWLPQEDWKNVEIEDMIESARKWMPVVQAEKPDLVIGLCGASYRYQENGNGLDTYKNPNGSVPTAIRVPGFDLMLMGGSSDREVFEVCNDAGQYVPCVQTGTTATHCGMIRVELTRQEDDQYQKRFFASIVNLKQYDPDPIYCQQVQDIQDTISQWLHEPMGELADTLYGADGLYGFDAYRQLIHKAQLWFSGADISMTGCLIGTDTVVSGILKPLSLFRIFPFANQLEVIEMQGIEVVRFLEYASSLQFETLKSSHDPLLLKKRDAQGNVVCDKDGHPYLAHSPVDMTSAAGIRYTIDVTKPSGQRVHVISMADGTPFDMRKTYRVALNSYQGRDRGQYFSKGLGWDIATINLHSISRPQFSVRYAIQEYIKAMAGEPIHLEPDGQWRLIPESLVQEAIAHEKQQPLPVW